MELDQTREEGKDRLMVVTTRAAQTKPMRDVLCSLVSLVCVFYILFIFSDSTVKFKNTL